MQNIPKDACNVVGRTRTGWNYQNNGLTSEELNETENEHLKKLESWKGSWSLRGENRKW